MASCPPRAFRCYAADAPTYGHYGVFHLPEGAVFRHLSRGWIDTLFAGLEIVDAAYPRVTTMNGHEAQAFRYLCRTG